MKDWKHKLQDLKYKNYCAKYPHAAKDGECEFVRKQPYKDTSANSLTSCILDFINYSGGSATRINNSGIMRKIDGAMKMTHSTTRKGVADIHAIIKGRHVSIEVKFGKDRMSKYQVAERERIERAGGIYYVATCMDLFTDWFEQTF